MPLPSQRREAMLDEEAMTAAGGRVAGGCGRGRSAAAGGRVLHRGDPHIWQRIQRWPTGKHFLGVNICKGYIWMVLRYLSSDCAVTKRIRPPGGLGGTGAELITLATRPRLVAGGVLNVAGSNPVQSIVSSFCCARAHPLCALYCLECRGAKGQHGAGARKEMRCGAAVFRAPSPAPRRRRPCRRRPWPPRRRRPGGGSSSG